MKRFNFENEVFLSLLEKVEAREAFESYTFATMLERVVVGRDGRLEFFFRNGMRYEHWLIERPVIREQTSDPLKNCGNLRAGVE